MLPSNFMHPPGG